MKIATVTSVTDPLNTKYWTYFASLASWSKETDTVYVVDGHSNENLTEVSERMFGPLDNVVIVREPETSWGPGDNWIFLQNGANWNLGVELASKDHDLVIVIGADQVAYPGTREEILRSGVQFPVEGGWYNFWRSKYISGQFQRRIDSRGVAIVPPKDGTSTPLVFGSTMATGHATDFPIRTTHHSTYINPESGAHVPVRAGRTEKSLGIIDIECGSFGHFWYTLEECQQKIERWDRSVSRYEGSVSANPRELYLGQGLYGYERETSAARWQSRELPDQFSKLIDEMFEPGMIGGASHLPGIKRKLFEFERKLWGASRRVRTRMARRRGLVGLCDLFNWVPWGDALVDPVDVESAYKSQAESLG